MGWNIRKRKEILPGVRLNLSKKGFGVSVGPEHTKISLSPGKRLTTNVGLPGTGIRYTKVINTKKTGTSNDQVDPNDVAILNRAVSNESDEIPGLEPLEQSRFAVEPRDYDEWKTTFTDIQELVDALSLVKKGEKNNLLCPDFPVKEREVAFIKVDGGLTNFDAIPHVDVGSVYVTNQRVIFMGAKKTLEWKFENMTTPLPVEGKGVMCFQCTDHQGISGVRVFPENWQKFNYFTLMIFAARDNLESVLQQAKTHLHSYEGLNPQK